MKNKLFVLLIVFASCHIAHAGSVQQSSGANSPIMRDINGSLTMIYKAPPDSPRMSSLEKKQEALFLVEHPTFVDVDNPRFTKWLADGNQWILTLTLKNTSKLPALDVSIELMNPKSSGQYRRLTAFKIGKTRTLQELEGIPYVVGPDAQVDYPLMNVKKLYDFLMEGDDSTACFVQGNPQLEKDNLNKFITSAAKILTLKIHFQTIFGEKISYFKNLTIYTVDRDSKKSDHNGKEVPLGCIDEKISEPFHEWKLQSQDDF